MSPSETLLRREFDVDALSPDQVAYFRDHLAEDHLPRHQVQSAAVDALSLELDDFVDAIRGQRQPRVTGEAGRDALAVAEQVLDRIASHAWDAALDGPVGPLAVSSRHAIPVPHFDLAAMQTPILPERAG